MSSHKIFNIFEILPLVYEYNNTTTHPTTHIQNNNIEIKIQHINEDISDNQNIEMELDVVSSTDFDDEDFVLKNIELGKTGETYVMNLMIKEHGNCRKEKAIEGYDFFVTANNVDYRIEVKSIQNYNAGFHITINEIKHAIKYAGNYYICFVVIPSLKVGVKDIRFLCNPADILGIPMPEASNGFKEECIIIPEKFYVKPKKGFIKSLNGSLG